MSYIHSFHIPVMGTAFTIDTPVKTAKYGISAVISLVEDALLEEMREFYCKERSEEYIKITKHEEDYRAKRITAYLNLINKMVQEAFQKIKNSEFVPGSEIIKYFELLPDSHSIKQMYKKMMLEENVETRELLQNELKSLMAPGSIDVNIMTKLDRTNYDSKRNELPQEYSDALSALRGYANSDLESSIIFSAGINRRLYSYIENFEDFYPDENGFIKKKIILKVSDYRSSLIQGQFLAKKGLWVSEYRIESGLNCGGHAFASDGYLMGPILEEFRQNRNDLKIKILNTCNKALESKNRPKFMLPPDLLITAQGGIGTFSENQFLLNYYEMDGTGWGTPFLLVPEATNVDEDTLQELSKAKEDDLYLSPVSPLGVPFNNLKSSASEKAKFERIEKGRPGSACPKGHLVSNTEFTERPICTASRQYQKLKIEQLEKLGLTAEKFKEKFNQVIQKSCICHDLGEAALIKNNIKPHLKKFAAICPGPNLAYFSKVLSLKQMVDHIYGRLNILDQYPRPNIFIKELKMYIDYWKKEVEKCDFPPTEKQIKYVTLFKNNILDGIQYYTKLFPEMLQETEEYRMNCLNELQKFRSQIQEFVSENKHIFDPNFKTA